MKRIISVVGSIWFVFALLGVLVILILVNAIERHDSETRKIRDTFKNAVIDDNSGWGSNKDYYDVYFSDGEHVRVQFAEDGKMLISRALVKAVREDGEI